MVGRLYHAKKEIPPRRQRPQQAIAHATLAEAPGLAGWAS
jgi:hypothetical protein